MKRMIPIILCVLPVLACGCIDYTPGDPDPTKCPAGEVWDKIKEACVPTGCELNIHCDDGLYCNGQETCGLDGKCVEGLPVECTGEFPCILGDCNEEEDRCDFRLGHELCPSGQVCDPAAGCVPGTACSSNSDCPPRFCFLEALCDNGICFWDTPRDCSDGFGCTEDKCNESQGKCELIAHDTFCESADRCLEGHCDPSDPHADSETGCVFVRLAGVPEVCDGIDNDCDELVDEKDNNTAEGSICACMTPCEGQADCNDLTGGNFQCLHLEQIGSFCVSACDQNGSCGATDPGLPTTCVTVNWGTVAPRACVCQPDHCPQACSSNRECFVYGLTQCMGGRCTSNCEADAECPYPYFCDLSLGHCSCAIETGASCLACVLSIHCDLMGLGDLCYYMDRGVPYNECKIHCYPETPCPYMPGDQLYCHQSTLCACRPPHGVCEDCQEGERVCEPYRMECTSVAGIELPPVSMCTAPCEKVEDCPAGWLCQWVEGSEKRCVDPFCLGCYQPACDPTDATSCDQFGNELECLPSGDNWGVCTKDCIDSRDCPVGWTCLDGRCGCY